MTAKLIVWIWTAVFVASVGQAGVGFHQDAGFAVLASGGRVELELKKILYTRGVRRYLELGWAAVVFSRRRIMEREGDWEKSFGKPTPRDGQRKRSQLV